MFTSGTICAKIQPWVVEKNLNEKLNSGFGPNARVNSIQVEVTFAHIFAILSLIIITPYNVLAADCLPVQIGDNYEK